MSEPNPKTKKLIELTVVELKNELEQRDLKRTGNKSALLERLRQAITDEGGNPDTIEFEIEEDQFERLTKALSKIIDESCQKMTERIDLWREEMKKSDQTLMPVGGSDADIDEMTDGDVSDDVASLEVIEVISEDENAKDCSVANIDAKELISEDESFPRANEADVTPQYAAGCDDSSFVQAGNDVKQPVDQEVIESSTIEFGDTDCSLLNEDIARSDETKENVSVSEKEKVRKEDKFSRDFARKVTKDFGFLIPAIWPWERTNHEVNLQWWESSRWSGRPPERWHRKLSQIQHCRRKRIWSRRTGRTDKRTQKKLGATMQVKMSETASARWTTGNRPRQGSEQMTDDGSINDPGFEEADLVWLYNPQRRKGRSPKLQNDWDGPYRILKKLNDVVYRIQKGSRTRPRVVHENRLCPYRGVQGPVRDGQF